MNLKIFTYCVDIKVFASEMILKMKHLTRLMNKTIQIRYIDLVYIQVRTGQCDCSQCPGGGGGSLWYLRPCNFCQGSQKGLIVNKKIRNKSYLTTKRVGRGGGIQCPPQHVYNSSGRLDTMQKSERRISQGSRRLGLVTLI